MVEEIPYAITGFLTEKGVVVDDEKAREELESRGYGEEVDGRFMLKDYEAIFLLYNGMIKLLEEDEEVSIDKLVDFAISRDPSAWTRFLIYRDLRSRGYVVREGFGFGFDFRVYDRGEYESKSAKYVVFGLNEGTKTPIRELNEVVDQIKRMGKEAVIAVIERRGEVIYYKIQSWRPYRD
ncbi:MAG: tRNA-intron lyase [archaeon]|nr:tRNA-intron lyase [archaeon]MCP8306787.1 tRNA-intron lyase [archaeon]